jgi:thimet oligopeptidase
LAAFVCCASILASAAARAQERELPLDRLTAASVAQLVDSSIARASLYRDSLLAVRGRRTVQNTLRLYDEMSIGFNISQIVGLLSNMHPDSAVRAAAADGVRRRNAFYTSLRLDPRIYRALRALDTTRADAEIRYYIARVIDQFQRDGVDRDSSTLARVAALRDEATRLERRFAETLRADTAPVAFADTTALSGLPPDWLQTQRRGPAGEVLVSPEDLRFVVQNADSLATRQLAVERLQRLGAPANHFVVDSLLHVREQLAAQLGYGTYAAYQFGNHMAGSPERVHAFLDDLQRRSETAVQRDIARAESLLGRPPVGGDQVYLVSHLVRRATTRPNSLRPYFPYERVRDALLHIADTLFGLQFAAAPDLPVWHPDVEAYRVTDGGKLVGIAYLDLRRRPGKPGGNATASLRVGVRGRVLPRTAITMSLLRARPGEPVLSALKRSRRCFTSSAICSSI